MVISAVWLILLALCGLIAIFVVPYTPINDAKFLLFVIDAGKVFVSLLVILVWLLGWYKSMDYLLQFEFYKSTTTLAPRDD